MACWREELCICRRETDALVLRSQEGYELKLPVAGWYTMDRLDLAELPGELERLGPDQICGWFVNQFFGSARRRQELESELQGSYLNIALSLQALEQLGPGVPGEGTLADWERCVWTGHPLHPGARLRSNMTAQDNRDYGPEWSPELALPLLSAPRESLCTAGEFPDRLVGLFPSLREFAVEGRVLVPVHPWQARHDLETRFATRFESGELIWSGATIAARPTMSFRTVVLRTEVGEDYHLKLPVAVQTTGATRTVSIAATQNGPLMSRFLERLLALPEMAEADLFSHLHLMGEPASFYLRDQETDRSRFLAGILRRGPAEGSGHEGRWLLPAQALLEPRHNPLFVRAARYYGVDPLTLFTNYCRRLLPAQAYLCGRLGIALEAHPQNVVVDFRGLPGQSPDIHFWYRDLGGIRLHRSRLARALADNGWQDRLEVPNFWPGSATSTESDRDLSSKFIYSLLQNHLGELIRCLVRQGVAGEELWRVVYQVLDEHRSVLGEDLEQRTFASEWDLKAMWTMRVDSAVTEYTYRPVKNPLWSGN